MSPDGPPVRAPADPDLIGVALGALAAGAAAGAAVVSVALVPLRDRLEHTLPLIVFAGIVTAALVGWTLARPIADGWRRGLTAALAVFAALILTVLTAPADRVAGPAGLLVYAGLLAVGTGAAARYSLRSRADGG